MHMLLEPKVEKFVKKKTEQLTHCIDRYSTDSDSITDSFVVAVGVLLYMNITTSTGFFSMMICRSYGVVSPVYNSANSWFSNNTTTHGWVLFSAG
ncbi:hypothetical protein P8452_62416 [Trifolium repens]|nr:hypothetical protein P8452_62416 [Trifolium repens]